MQKVFFQGPPINGDSLEFKRIMANAIEDWISQDPRNRSKKLFAYLLSETEPDTLSHWISPRCGWTMHGHLIRLFCEITGSWELYRWLGKRGKRRAS